MIAEYSSRLQREFGSKEIKAVIGDVPDYTSLVFLHLDATKGEERLFGGKYNYGYARTKTPTFGSSVANVGCFFNESIGLQIRSGRRGSGNHHVYVAPLVVPV